MTKSKFRPKQHQRKEGVVRKRKKLNIVFDQDARKEYLTGFQKRKQEKKAKYRVHLEKKVAAEKNRLKEQARKSINFRSSSHSILPEVENLLAADMNNATPQFSNSVSHEIGSKTVTISTIDTLHPQIPKTEPDDDENDHGVEDETTEQKEEEPPADAARLKSMLKKTTNQLLQRSKAFKAVQKLKTKKNRRKQMQRQAGRKDNFAVKKQKEKEKADKGKGGLPRKNTKRKGSRK